VNIVEKALDEASDREQVRPGEIVNAKISSAMVHDITGPPAVQSWKSLEDTKVLDPDRIHVIFDHFLPAPTEQAAKPQKMIREFVESPGILTQVADGDQVSVNLEQGQIRNLTSGATISTEPFPLHLLQVLNDGGIIEHLKKKRTHR
jgi:homoaconitase/3-isopropylmalate dehydratase large subunit